MVELRGILGEYVETRSDTVQNGVVADMNCDYKHVLGVGNDQDKVAKPQRFHLLKDCNPKVLVDWHY